MVLQCSTSTDKPCLSVPDPHLLAAPPMFSDGNSNGSSGESSSRASSRRGSKHNLAAESMYFSCLNVIDEGCEKQHMHTDRRNKQMKPVTESRNGHPIPKDFFVVELPRRFPTKVRINRSRSMGATKMKKPRHIRRTASDVEEGTVQGRGGIPKISVTDMDSQGSENSYPASCEASTDALTINNNLHSEGSIQSLYYSCTSSIPPTSTCSSVPSSPNRDSDSPSPSGTKQSCTCAQILRRKETCWMCLPSLLSLVVTSISIACSLANCIAFIREGVEVKKTEILLLVVCVVSLLLYITEMCILKKIWVYLHNRDEDAMHRETELLIEQFFINFLRVILVNMFTTLLNYLRCRSLFSDVNFFILVFSQCATGVTIAVKLLANAGIYYRLRKGLWHLRHQDEIPRSGIFFVIIVLMVLTTFFGFYTLQIILKESDPSIQITQVKFIRDINRNSWEDETPKHITTGLISVHSLKNAGQGGVKVNISSPDLHAKSVKTFLLDRKLYRLKSGKPCTRGISSFLVFKFVYSLKEPMCEQTITYNMAWKGRCKDWMYYTRGGRAGGEKEPHFKVKLSTNSCLKLRWEQDMEVI
ncbi:uncharacterized protein [Branchiostoma lanceolatum]|uniref:uncharacterized protein n=1 Tax=Branchiostoma lanceolatum TaxID=7740 RepID=UPI0034538429